MSQEDINKDLDHYIKEKHRREPFWKKFKPKPKLHEEHEEIQQELKKDLEEAQANEDITPQDKAELEQIEGKIEEVNTVEEKVEEEIDTEREGLLQRFFKKLNFGKKEHEVVESDDLEEHKSHEDNEEELSDEEMKQFLKNTHAWITQLPPETQKAFKESKDFELYTKVLKKHNLIK